MLLTLVQKSVSASESENPQNIKQLGQKTLTTPQGELHLFQGIRENTRGEAGCGGSGVVRLVDSVCDPPDIISLGGHF